MQANEEQRPPARGKRKRAISPTRSDGADHLATDSDQTGAAVQRSDQGATSVLSAMWDQLDETHDVQLLVSEDGEDVLLCAHRAVLAASSRYFKSLLCGGCKERAWRSTVPLHDVGARSVRSLLLFVYGQRVELTVEEALPLYRVSDMYEVLELADSCCDFLARKTTADNCCTLLAAAEAAKCEKVSSHCFQQAKRQFEQAAATDAFCELAPRLVLDLLREEELQARSEEVLLLALLRWYDHAPEARREDTLEMAELVRWPFIPASTVATLEQERPRLFEEQHGQSASLAVPQFSSCASSGRAWRLWAARHSQEESSPLGTQPLPPMLEPAASKAADATAFL